MVFSGQGNVDDVGFGDRRVVRPSIASRLSIGPSSPASASPVRGLARRIWAPTGQERPSGSASNRKPLTSRSCGSNSGQGQSDFEIGEGRAVQAAADHRFCEQFRPDAGASRFASRPTPKASHILRQFAMDEIGAIAAEVAAAGGMRGRGQETRVFFALRQRRRLRRKAIFVAIAQQQFAEREQVRVGAIGPRARRARAIPIEGWLRDAIDEAERFDAAHVACRQDVDNRQAAALDCFARRALQRPDAVGFREQHEQNMRLAPADAPPPIRRRVGADVAETLRAVRAARQALHKFRPESLNNRFLDAESPQSCGGEGNLCRFGDLRGNSVRREIRQRSRPEPAEPGPRRARVGDAQQQIARAGQRAEGGFRDRLNVGAVDVPSRHASKPGHISASQRRISSSLIVAFSKPLRMRVLRARSRAVRPG